MPALLEASDLTIRRGRRIVLSGVELALHPGAAIHLAGANGSGKTSLLRVFAGLAAQPSSSLSKGMLQRVALLEAVHARCPLGCTHRVTVSPRLSGWC